MIREFIAYVFAGYHEGSFKHTHYRSDEMKSWIGTRKDERGNNFAIQVAGRLQELGWETPFIEKHLSLFLNKSRDEEYGPLKPYGDVDVLAYRESDKRVLVAECKFLQRSKTTGEIAEQLNDYRGLAYMAGRKEKKDDLLKHLRRVEVLTQRREELLKKLKLPSGFKVEGWIVFRHPVPMLFSWEQLKDKMQISTYDDLSKTFRQNKGAAH